MHDCIFKLLRGGDEGSLESMCKLMFTIGKDLDSDKAKVIHFLLKKLGVLLIEFLLYRHWTSMENGES
jgi:hypothetical protein